MVETLMTPTPVTGSRPDPDPTERTIDSLRREIGALRELIEARLDGGDKAIKLLQETTDRFPAHVDRAVFTLEKLHSEKFESIQVQFKERDVRTEQSGVSTKTAVDAALQAAKEAVGAQNVSSAQAIAKSEAATTKQIDAIGTLISTQAKGTDDKIDDIKSRLQSIEARKAGMGDAWGVLIGAASLIVAAVVVAGFVIARL